MPSSRSSAVVVRLYRAIVALGPPETRARHGDEQVQLFEALWLEERPTGTMLAARWVCAMLWGALASAIGARRDRRRRMTSLEPNGAGGAPFGDWRIGMSDVRYAIRSLVHAKWFTIGAILTFALAIGVNIAIFSIVDRVLFRPLPYQHPRDLVLVTSFSPGTGTRYTSLSKQVAVELRRRRDVIEDLGFARLTGGYRFVGSVEPPISLVDCSSNILDVLGIHPIAGRGFLPEDVSNKHVVAMLTFEVWQRRFGGQTNVLGKLLTGSGLGSADVNQPTELVGVLPPNFILPSVNWAAGGDGIVLSLESLDTATRTGVVFPGVFARLKPGATIEALQNEIDAIFASGNPDAPPERRDHAIVERLQTGVFWRYNLSMTLLFGGASLVWLLGCANLGTLMLARARSRETEVAVRTALGASRGRILSAAILESLMVCVAGSLVAGGVIALAMKSLTAIVPGPLKTVVAAGLDTRIVAFTAFGAAIGAIVAGLYPAWRSTRVDPNLALKQGTSTGRRVTGRSGRSLLVAQSAIATVLMVAAVLTTRSLIGLLTVDLGYAPNGLYRPSPQPPPASATSTPSPPLSVQERQRASRLAIARLRDLPFIAAASATNSAVFGNEAPDRLVDDGGGNKIVVRRVVDDFFKTMETPLLAGRVFTLEEIDASAPVVVLSRTAATRLFPAGSPDDAIGQTVRFQKEPPRLVIGIVADTRVNPTSAVEPEVITPVRDDDRLMVLVRVRSGAPIDAAAMRPAFEMKDRPIANVGMTPVNASLEYYFRDPMLYAKIFGAFAVVALVLSSVGLFAIASGEVSRRLHEIGVRRTLGANAGQIRSLILGDSLRPVAIGVAVGGVVAWWAASVMSSLLFVVTPRDPWSYGIVALVLFATAAVAALAPARRAARVDPSVILRAQ